MGLFSLTDSLSFHHGLFNAIMTNLAMETLCISGDELKIFFKKISTPYTDTHTTGAPL